jgi:hypothetical protein
MSHLTPQFNAAAASYARYHRWSSPQIAAEDVFDYQTGFLLCPQTPVEAMPINCHHHNDNRNPG